MGEGNAGNVPQMDSHCRDVTPGWGTLMESSGMWPAAAHALLAHRVLARGHEPKGSIPTQTLDIIIS